MAQPEAVERLHATFGAAMDFGLTEEQVWEAVREVCEYTPADQPAAECLDEVAAILAARISKEA
jgi:hypothetical protein